MPSTTFSVPDLVRYGPTIRNAQVFISKLLEEKLQSERILLPEPVPVQAMVDTGAAGTVIKDDVPPKLGLHPVGQVKVTTPSTADMLCDVYFIRIGFQAGVTVETTAIATPLENQHVQCLIGRDVLARGVLIYIGYVNSFTLSF